MAPGFLRTKRTVEQEHASGDQGREHVVTLKKNPLMARDEIRLGDQVARMNRLWPKAEMGNGHRARFFGVIHEITLGMVICVLADDFYRILVRADRAIGS